MSFYVYQYTHIKYILQNVTLFSHPMSQTFFKFILQHFVSFFMAKIKLFSSSLLLLLHDTVSYAQVRSAILATARLLVSSFHKLMQWRGVRRPSVCLRSVNFFALNRFSQVNGRIATKLAHDGLQVSMHPGCAQG